MLTQAASRVSINPWARRCAFASSGQLHITVQIVESLMANLFWLLPLVYLFAEPASIAWLAGQIGWGWVLLEMALAFSVGTFMLRNHKFAFMPLLAELRAGTLSVSGLLRLARYYIAAILFIIPGPLGDVLALILLLPWSLGNTTPLSNSRPDSSEDGVIEGDYRRVDSEQKDRLIGQEVPRD